MNSGKRPGAGSRLPILRWVRTKRNSENMSLSLLNKIRQFSHKAPIKKITLFFHIRSFMNSVYLHLFPLTVPRNGIKKISFFGIEAYFQAKTASDLMTVEDNFLDARAGGEGHVLKYLLTWLKPDDVAYDIGAYIGSHMIYMAKCVGENGRIVAFEPERQRYELALTNINLNNLKNVTLFEVALGAEFGEAFLHSDTGHCLNLMNFGNSLGQRVKIVPGDFLVKTQGLPSPKILKIDVEGYEYYVICGLQNTLRQATCQALCCEIHPTMLPPDIKPQKVIDLLKSLGFTHIETHPRGVVFHAFCSKS